MTYRARLGDLVLVTGVADWRLTNKDLVRDMIGTLALL